MSGEQRSGGAAASGENASERQQRFKTAPFVNRQEVRAEKSSGAPVLGVISCRLAAGRHACLPVNHGKTTRMSEMGAWPGVDVLQHYARSPTNL